MIPYVYSVVRCRHAVVRAEQRNVGLLVVSPTERMVWLRRGDLRRAGLSTDAAAQVQGWLDILEQEAQTAALAGNASVAHDWIRRRAAPSEDTLTLGEPGIGVSGDLRAEVRLLEDAYLGPAAA